MEEITMGAPRSGWRAFARAYDVWIFAAVTVLLTVALILLPLPVLAGPALVVFIPTLVAAALIRINEGKGQIRSQLFSAKVWGASLKWVLISLLLGIALRLAVSLFALVFVPGYELQPGPFTPFLLITFLFAAGEEIGWRGFALPRLLKSGVSPLKAALGLGIPWALLHLPLSLPGKLAFGVPLAATFLVILSLSVILTWLYLNPGGKLLPPVLLHGGQNATAILNNGIPLLPSNWLMALVYGIAALTVIVVTRGSLGGNDGRIEKNTDTSTSDLQ